MLLKFVLFSLLVTVTSARRHRNPFNGQVSGTLGEARIFPENTVLTDFAVDGRLKGLRYNNGKLVVTKTGFYFIYAQAWFEILESDPWYNRVALCVNGEIFSVMQHAMDGRAAPGSLYSGGVVRLRKGDYISMKTVYRSHMWITKNHTFMGAFNLR